MTLYRKNIGKTGEEIALKLLQDKDYKIIFKNFRSRYAEIDIIAQKKDLYIFVEVKTRVGDAKGKPYEAINPQKIHHIKRAVEYFLLLNKIKGYKLRIDVISIILDSQLLPVEIKHFENAG